MIESEGKKKPFQVNFWKFGDDRYLNKCPERKNKDSNMYNMKEAYTLGDIARSIPHIYALTLDNLQEDHQSTMIEIEGKINNFSISILLE